MQGRISRPALLPIGLVAAVALVFALWTGLFQLGVAGAPPVPVHGPLMVLGFLGTVIAVERAVGLGQVRAWAAPILSAMGTVLVMFGQFRTGMAVLTVAGAALVAVYLVAMRIAGYVDHLLVGAMGAVSWVVAAAAMFGQTATSKVVPSLAVFLVLTIIGERIELSRMAPNRSQTRSWIAVGAAAVLLVSSAVSMWWGVHGLHIAGASMVLLAVISASGDIARQTIRMKGLTAFMAAAILAGYVWLVISGLLWATERALPGTAYYDAALHTLFIGFVMSMIFAHSAVILPSVAGIQLPYHPTWWIGLAALHLTLLLRVLGGVLEDQLIKEIGGTGNVVSIGLFVALAVSSSIRRRGSSPG